MAGGEKGNFGKGGKKGKAPWDIEVIDLNDDDSLNKLDADIDTDDQGEKDDVALELDRETELRIEAELGENALNMMTVDTSEDYEKMRRFNTMERFEAERQMASKMRQDAKGIAKVGLAVKNFLVYGLGKNMMLANIAADQENAMNKYHSIYASENKEGRANIDKSTGQALGDKFLVKRFTDRLNGALESDKELEDDEIEKSEDAEREAEVKNELKVLAEAAASGDAETIKEARKNYKEAVKKWRKEGLGDEEVPEDPKGIFGKVKNFFSKNSPKMQADNYMEVGDSIIKLGEKIKDSDIGIDAVKDYVDKHVSLYNAESKSAINTEYRDRWQTEMALDFGMGGAILATAVGPIKTALKNLPGISKVAMSTVLGAGFGALRGNFAKDANFSKRDMAQALGRQEVKKGKFAIAEKLAEKMTGAETGIYKSAWNIEEVFGMPEQDGGSATGLQKYMNRIATEDGGERWEIMEGLSDDERVELARYIGRIQARLNVGSEMGVQLITFNLGVGEDAGKTQQDLYRLDAAIGAAKRGLRSAEGNSRKMQWVDMNEMENAYNSTADVLRTNIAMENEIREKVGKKIVMIDAVAGGMIAGAATTFGLVHRLMKNNPDMSAKEGIVAALGFKNKASVAETASEMAGQSPEDVEAPDEAEAVGGRFEVPDDYNQSMDGDNVVLMEDTDADGSRIYKVYDAYLRDGDASADAEKGYFGDTGIEVKYNDDNTMTEESLQKLQAFYGNKYEYGEVEMPKVATSAELPTGELGDGVNVIDEPIVGGNVTTMSTYIHEDGNNWVINVWSTGRGKELADGDMRYYFEVGDGDSKSVLTCDIDDNGVVTIPKDSILGNMIKEDQNGDGVPEFLAKSHGVVEITDGKAVTQASMFGTGEYTPDNLKTAATDAGLVEEAKPVNVAYDYKFTDADGNETIIRAPRQVYSEAVSGESAINARYTQESFGKNIILRDETINYGESDAANDALQLHRVEHVGGYNYSADALSIGKDGEKVKDIYEGAAILKDEGMYDENNVFKAEDFNALSAEQKDEYAVQAMQELTNDASANGVKAESWSSLFAIEGKAGRTMSEINDAGIALNIGDDAEYDAQVNSMMGDVYERLKTLDEAGFKPEIKTLPVGTFNSSEYVSRDVVRRLLASPNMVTSEEEAYVTLTNSATGESLVNNTEITDSFRKALGVPEGAIIDEIGFKLKCRQPFASWHMPAGVSTPNTITEEQIQIIPTPDDVIQPPETTIPPSNPPVTPPNTTTPPNTPPETTRPPEVVNPPEDTRPPEEVTPPEESVTPPEEPETPPIAPPAEEEGLTPKTPSESANMGNENINYNPDVNSDNTLGEDQFDSSREFNREAGRFEDINATGTDNPAAAAEGGFDQSGAARVSTTLTDDQQAAQAAANAAQAEADNNFESQAAAASEAIEQGQASIAAEQEASNFMDSYQGPADWTDDAGDDVSASDFTESGGLGEVTDEGEL